MREFTCDTCKGIFITGWTDKEAKEEFFRDHQETIHHMPDHVGIVCDNCHEKITEWLSALSPEQKKFMREEYDKEMGLTPSAPN